MHNNILNGWRLAITKIVIACGLLYIISLSLPVISSAFNISPKWMCGSSKEVGLALTSNDEGVIATGIVSENNLLMTFWANSLGDWTLVATGNAGEYSCVVVHGKGFRPRQLSSGTII